MRQLTRFEVVQALKKTSKKYDELAERDKNMGRLEGAAFWRGFQCGAGEAIVMLTKKYPVKKTKKAKKR